MSTLPQAMSYSDSVAPQLEAVTPLLTGMYDQARTLYNKFSKITVSEQSGRNNRMPILLRPGGAGQAVNLDNGDLGQGSAPKFDFTSMSPVDFTYNIAWSLKAKFTTDSSKKSEVDVVQMTIAESIKESQAYIDKHLQGAGDGILGSITSGGGTTAWTTTAPFYNYLLRPGMPLAAYATGQGTLRGQCVVVKNDTQSHIVTVDTDPGTSNTDVFCVGGLTATPPVWIYGIPYNHNNSTAGTFLGWTRSSYPEVRTPTVNANSGALTPDLLNQLLAQLDSVMGEDVTDSGSFFWYVNPKRHFDLIQYLTMISEITLSGDNGQVDAGFSRKNQRRFAGIPIVTSINADPTRVDLIDGKNWIRAVYKEFGWLKLGGSTILPVPNGNGSYNATEISYLAGAQQFAVKNPRRGAYISTLAGTLS